MGDSLPWRMSETRTLPAVRRRGGALAGVFGVAATLATGLVLAAAAVLAVIFAATLAVVMALATALLALSLLALRIRRRSARLALSGRGPGHAWIAYRWDAH